jgi:hypothetical protein
MTANSTVNGKRHICAVADVLKSTAVKKLSRVCVLKQPASVPQQVPARRHAPFHDLGVVGARLCRLPGC